MVFSERQVKFVLLPAVVGLLLAVTACAVRPVSNAPVAGMTDPAIRITTPPNFYHVQTTVNTRNITVNVAVINFQLVDRIGQPAAAGEGHIHYYLDANPPLDPGLPAITAEGEWVHGTGTSHTWTNLSDGPHMLAVQLVNNDETPLSPPAYHWIQTYLQYDILAPWIEITAPKNGSNISAGDVTVSVKIHNFVVIDRLDKPNLSGQGHLHYFIDVDPPITLRRTAITAEGTWAESLEESFTWHNISPGNHTFAVELVSNDHMPLYPASLRPAYDTVTINVTTPD